jgi:hypothetical protein
MPATTAISALPATRPDIEVQIGAIPGYHLSSAVDEDPEGASVLQPALARAWVSARGRAREDGVGKLRAAGLVGVEGAS